MKRINSKMCKLICALLVCLCINMINAAVYSGAVTIPHGGDAFDKNSVALEFGDKLKLKSYWSARRIFGREAISAGFTVKNPTSHPMFFSYYVAFFDAAGKLIGSASYLPINKSGIEAGKDEQNHSIFIYLPDKKYNEISSYQVTIYESDNQGLN